MDAMNEDARFEGLIAEGLAASRENRTEAARDLFAQASALMPASGIPHFLIGSEHAAAGDIEKAEAAMANAVLPAPVLPAIGPSRSSTVITSAMSWHGWVRSVSPLITGILA